MKNTALFTKKTLFNFLFFFLIIFSYYIAKPIRNSLFLEWMGPQQLPFVYLLSALLSLVSALAINTLLTTIPPVKLIPAAIGFSAGGLILFRSLLLSFTKAGPALSFTLYLFISLFAVVVVSLFWATCNDAHAPGEEKKSYNIIGIGGILGGLLGGEVTRFLAVKIGTENLLLISAGLLLISLPLPWMIINLRLKELKVQPAPLRVPQKQQSTNNRAASLIQNPYLLSIAGLVFISTVLGSLMDFQYQGIIKEAALLKDARTALFGRIFTLINISGIVIHLLITRPVLSRFGAKGGLLPLPIIAMVGTVLLWLFPSIKTLTIIWVFYGGFAYSLNQVTRETLYVPVPRNLKYAAKFYIDMFVFRFGDAMVALLLMVSNIILKAPRIVVYSYNIFFCILWIALIYHFTGKYSTLYTAPPAKVPS